VEVIDMQQTNEAVETERYWQAVCERDNSQDGAFVYAVRSTGIYCRPSCSSRRPRREQVDFFAISTAAELAGYRACKRCRPQAAAAPNPQAELVLAACSFIDNNLDGTLTLEEIGATVGASPHHLQRVFKALLGVSPREYADARRIIALKDALREGDSVAGALYSAGYSSSSRVYERSDALLGMTPATYKAGGKGMNIGYTIVDSPLGRLLVAATERGVCAVSLGDDDAALAQALREEYPKAEVEEAAIEPTTVSILLDYLNGARPDAKLPLDVQATAFQRQVWQALQAIPYGETRTYGELARELGNPNAMRAVGRACATNPVSLIVPCHRAVGSDGKLHGFRWGLERKQALLQMERGE
jgi:AraC family transcriptional regulator, regulatory protein of adaptative response / methylated-DNA-[protein]-cysteine methyltransferase